MVSKSDNSVRLAYIFLIICAILYGTLLFLTPPQLDDLSYGVGYQDVILQDKDASRPGVGELMHFFGRHWENVNGRLGDKFMLIALVCMPKWLFSLTGSISMWLTLALACNMAFGSIRRHPLRSIMLTSLLMLCLPWGSMMFLVNTFLNYVLPMPLIVATMLYYFRPCRCCNLRTGTALYLLALLAGWWHEAFPLTFLPAMIWLSLRNPKATPISGWILLAGLLTGLIMQLCAPSFWQRIHSTASPPVISSESLLIALKATNITLLLPILGLCTICCRKTRSALSSMQRTSILTGIVAMILTFGIFLMSVQALRVWWFTDLICIIILCMTVPAFLPRLPKMLLRIITIGVALSTIASACIAICQLKGALREYCEIIKLYTSSTDGIVYYDRHYRGYGHPFALHKGMVVTFTPDNINYSLAEFYRPHDCKPLRLLPATFRSFSPKETRPLSLHHFFRYKDCFLSTDTTLISQGGVWLGYRLANGDIRYAPTLLIPLPGRPGGQRWAWLDYDRRYLSADPIDIVSL